MAQLGARSSNWFEMKHRIDAGLNEEKLPQSVSCNPLRELDPVLATQT